MVWLIPFSVSRLETDLYAMIYGYWFHYIVFIHSGSGAIDGSQSTLMKIVPLKLKIGVWINLC